MADASRLGLLIISIVTEQHEKYTNIQLQSKTKTQTYKPAICKTN